MDLTISRFATILAALCLAPLNAQQPNKPAAAVPRLVRLNGSFHAANGLPVGPTEGVTLSVYQEELGGVPLWQETQNVSLDANGQYIAMLGITQKDGVPVDLFSSTEPRWLGVQFIRSGETEQARVRLVSVPYALEAVDAGMLGGRPASAYLLSPTGATTDSADESGTTTPGSTLDVTGDINFSGSIRYPSNPVVQRHPALGWLGNGDIQNDLDGFTMAVGKGALNRPMKRSPKPTPIPSPIRLTGRLRR